MSVQSVVAEAVEWVGERVLLALLKAILDGDKDKAARLATAAAAKKAIRVGRP